MRKRKSPKTLDITRVFGHGAGGGTRTHTLSPAKDFESSSSANSNTPARLFLKSLLKITNRKLEGYAGGMLRRNTVFSFQKFPVYQGLSHPAWETAKSILSPPRLPIPSFRLTDVILTYVVAFCNGVFPRIILPGASFSITLTAAIVYQKVFAYYAYKLGIARLNGIVPPHYFP